MLSWEACNVLGGIAEEFHPASVAGQMAVEASKVDASFDKRPLAIKDAIPAESGATARKVAIKAQSRKVTHPLLGSPTVALT